MKKNKPRKVIKGGLNNSGKDWLHTEAYTQTEARPKRKIAQEYTYQCSLHNFKTNSIRRWKKHESSSTLKHRLQGAIQCPNCHEPVQLIDYPVAKLNRVKCDFCGKVFDYRKEFLEVPEGKIITSDQLVEILHSKSNMTPKEFQDEVIRVGVNIQ
jgi:hypothetical protein